jgi:uncharacterized protein with FMN-binding domain
MKQRYSVLAALGLAVTLLFSCGPGKINYAETVSWDGSYDVIVVGFGGAGAVASITAADAGAEVLLVEKAPRGHHGGNTRVAGQYILDFADFQSGFDYLKGLRGDFFTTSDDELAYLVKGLMENDEWLLKMGAKNLIDISYPEYPEIAGAKGVRLTMVESKDFSDAFNARYWQLLERNVNSRKDKIDVWYESPAMHLIQDPVHKTILGVEINKEGVPVTIQAKNGVVLACGGFENNRLMIQNYTQRPVVFPIGTTYNEGDGVRMVMEAGADLWHMSATSGPFLSYFSLGNDQQGLFDLMRQNVLSPAKSVLNVGPDGKRFTNEGVGSRHGFISYNGVYRPQLAVQPMYAIFDEAARLTGPVHPSFSAGNSAEIQGGLIKKAASIRELAALIGYDPSVLENTVNEFNAMARQGKDSYFNRSANTMSPLGSGPYYALELVPAYVNTQGGARRNIECEVLDPQEKPIPHLYSAGEFGSFFADQYNAGGNLGETMVTGRTAGANAAKPKDPPPPIEFKKAASRIVYTLGSHVEAETELASGPGEYLGEGTGMGGVLTLSVKMDNGRITDVKIVSHMETPGISDMALETIPRAIVEAQSAEVDVVSGATMTSRAIISAAEDALRKVAP